MTTKINEWKKKDGEIRRYVNDWWELVGIEYNTYKTGNVSYSARNGEAFAHGRMRILLNAKVWIDEQNEVHLDYFDGCDIVSEGEVIRAVKTFAGISQEC